MTGQEVTVSEAEGCAVLTFGAGTNGNLLDNRTITDLTSALEMLSHEPRLRMLVLSSRGDSFCRGIDLNWMITGAEAPLEENIAGALTLTGLFKRVFDFPKPTLARIQGDAFGAGVGLIAACDIAVCANPAKLGVREVRNGIIPAALSPYFMAAVGARRARDYFLTARVLSAREAHSIGLVQYLCASEGLDSTVEEVRRAILRGSPDAAVATKELVRAVVNQPIDDELVMETAHRIATIRATPLAHAGIKAALDGSVPPWRQ